MEQSVLSQMPAIWTKAQMAVDYAKLFITTPYVWGGNDTAQGGLDCSGLVIEALSAFGLWEGGDMTAQQVFTTLTSKCSIHGDAQKGDILFFGETRMKITHIALATSDWQMVEAGGGGRNPGKGMVRLRPIAHRKDLVAILRFK